MLLVGNHRRPAHNEWANSCFDDSGTHSAASCSSASLTSYLAELVSISRSLREALPYWYLPSLAEVTRMTMARIQSASSPEALLADAPFQNAILRPGWRGWYDRSLLFFVCAAGPTDVVRGGRVIETPLPVVWVDPVPAVLDGDDALGRLLRLSAHAAEPLSLLDL